MSIKYRFITFFSPSFTSHFDKDYNLKRFEQYRIDMVKELDYRVLNHKFDIIEKGSSSAIYNKAQAAFSEMVDDFFAGKAFEVVYDTILFTLYSISYLVNLFTGDIINPVLIGQAIVQTSSNIVGLFCGTKVSQFHYNCSLKDASQYESEIRKAADYSYYQHKLMIDYENSSYLKLAIISYTDIFDNLINFAKNDIKLIFHIVTFNPKSCIEDVSNIARYLGNVLYDVAASTVYTIGALVEKLEYHCSSFFKDVDQAVLDNLDKTAQQAIDEYYHANDNKSAETTTIGKLFNSIKDIYNISKDVFLSTYYSLTFHPDKSFNSIKNLLSDFKNLYFDSLDTIGNLGNKIEEYFTSSQTEHNIVNENSAYNNFINYAYNIFSGSNENNEIELTGTNSEHIVNSL